VAVLCASMLPQPYSTHESVITRVGHRLFVDVGGSTGQGYSAAQDINTDHALLWVQVI